MTPVRRALFLLLAAATLVAGGLAWTASSASSATAPTYSLTYAGTDAHSLDPHLEAIFVDGGGVQPVLEQGIAYPKFPYLEIGLNLPAGAKVTSITYVYSYCADSRGAPSFVFGSYAPASGNTVPVASLKGTHCGRTTLTKTGNPLATTAAGRRYVLDYAVGDLTLYPGDGSQSFYGATIKYTCTSPCVP